MQSGDELDSCVIWTKISIQSLDAPSTDKVDSSQIKTSCCPP